MAGAIDRQGLPPYGARPREIPRLTGRAMKVINSLRSAKIRHKNCQVVRRKGRVYVINKKDPRFKARQG